MPSSVKKALNFMALLYDDDDGGGGDFSFTFVASSCRCAKRGLEIGKVWRPMRRRVEEA